MTSHEQLVLDAAISLAQALQDDYTSNARQHALHEASPVKAKYTQARVYEACARVLQAECILIERVNIYQRDRLEEITRNDHEPPAQPAK